MARHDRAYGTAVSAALTAAAFALLALILRLTPAGGGPPREPGAAGHDPARCRPCRVVAEIERVRRAQAARGRLRPCP